MSQTLSLTFSCVSPRGVRGEGWRRLRAGSSERLLQIVGLWGELNREETCGVRKKNKKSKKTLFLASEKQSYCGLFRTAPRGNKDDKSLGQ